MPQVTLTVNGKTSTVEVEGRTLLVELLREKLRLTGTHVGCDTSQCGACVVHVDGESVKACTVLAVQADGTQVTTIEGLAKPDGTLHPMQEAFREYHALQCGFCTPGMVMSAIDLVQKHPAGLSEKEIREGLEGNLCRCTGYHNIVKAIAAAQEVMHGRACRPWRSPGTERRQGARQGPRARVRRDSIIRTGHQGRAVGSGRLGHECRDPVRGHRRQRAAQGRPAVPLRPRAIHRRHQPPWPDLCQHPAQPACACDDRRHRHRRGPGHAGGGGDLHRGGHARPRRHPLRLADPQQGRLADGGADASGACRGQGALRRRCRGGGDRRDQGAGAGRGRGHRGGLRGAAGGLDRDGGDGAGRAAGA